MLKARRYIQLCVITGLLLSAILASIAFGLNEDSTVTRVGRHLLEEESDELSNYPTDLLSKEQRRNGGFMLHFIGALYMFCSLAIICDEFFVPSLEIITEKLQLQDDVAGATFLAAGGSAPELATAFMGTFISKSDVGFGTIVGSAVFNILFVIGACAYVAEDGIELSWWPLFRDSVYYCISLGVLIGLFYDKEIEPWEAAIQFAMYILYVVMMMYNRKLEIWFKSLIGSPMTGAVQTIGSDEEDNEKEVENPANNQSKEEHTQMHYNIHKHFQASRKSRANMLAQDNSLEPIKMSNGIKTEGQDNEKIGAASDAKVAAVPIKQNSLMKDDASEQEDGSDSEDGPLDLKFPQSPWKRFTYILLAPITYSFYYTIPDVRRPGYENYYVLGFIMSIVWIGVSSFFMVWWITVVGDSMGIPSAIMGLTVLAIGTSIPDLLESIIVAKQGKGDMAVSSSLGSNIFDITVGLPLPWLLYTLIYSEAIKVGTDGLIVSVIMLFAMLACCISVIAYLEWKMNKTLGVCFFILWVVFLAISLINEYVFS